MRTFRRLMLAVAMVAGGIVATAGPAAAAEPKAGEPCSVGDLGKRWPQIESSAVEPTITHFTSFFVTDGTIGEREVRLETQNVIEVMVNNEVFIKTGFSVLSLFNVEAHAKRVVQKITRTTGTQAEIVRWRFEQPGYYGVYKGTRKVSGTYSGLNCHRVGNRLEWIKREVGPYRTFSNMEEGAVRCADVVPPNSLMYKAQEALGCFGAPATRRPGPPSSTVDPDAGAVIAAVPPGFTCDPTRYRIGVGNGLYWYYPKSNTIDTRPFSARGAAGFSLKVCRGPGEGDLVEYALITTAEGRCLSIQEAAVNEDAATIDDLVCRTVDDNQRWYLYRDAPNSNAIGIQVKRNGHMLGQNRIADFEDIRHFSSGKEDGTGTYYLEPMP